MDGERELSDARTGFTGHVLLNERPPDGYTWSGRRLTRKQTTSRPDNVWPDVWKHMSDAAKSKAKQKWAIEKPKLDNAMQLRGTFFIEPDDEEFENIMKKRSWKVGNSDASFGKTRPNMLLLSMPTNLCAYDWKACRTGTTKITSLRKE